MNTMLNDSARSRHGDRPGDEGQSRPRYGRGREALIDATIHIVAERGVRKLTYRAVAAAAGVTHGTVQHHFADLDALLEAALEHCVQLSIDRSWLATGTTEVSDFVANLGAAIRETVNEQVFQYELVLESRRRPELRPHVDRYYRAYYDATRTSLRRMNLPDDHNTVVVVFSAIDGLVFRALTTDDGGMGTLDDYLDRVREVLDGLPRVDSGRGT
ncbi:TetR/AcrR family transcriptional regulator [Millisia brevis]|uniref:TetR/AcrR family transcriptional regulator n=1 Tax=Millisia brevis TaxID=264148 RepID=UPI00147248F0|nr:TetR/AcrR family transcriptional regulator [Millisia brevis]